MLYYPEKKKKKNKRTQCRRQSLRNNNNIFNRYQCTVLNIVIATPRCNTKSSRSYYRFGGFAGISERKINDVPAYFARPLGLIIRFPTRSVETSSP